MSTTGKIALCSDHAGYELKSIIEGYLESQGIEYTDFGTFSADSCDYADFAHPAALAVESGECYPGIAICGTGNGIGMTLNKHQGIRAGMAWMEDLADLAKRHNNANFLVLPARFIADDLAKKIVDAYLAAPFEGGRHERRIEKMVVKD